MVTSTKQSKKPRAAQSPSRKMELRNKISQKTLHNTSWHDRMPVRSYPHPQRDINSIFNDIIRMKKDILAETRTSYVLPHPEQSHDRPAGVNIDYCCQDYGIDTEQYPHTLNYQSSLADVYRKMWDR